MRVSISYSHHSPEHGRRVLELSDRLRQEGIDCSLDQYEISPPEGWPQWMDRQIDQAARVSRRCPSCRTDWQSVLRRTSGWQPVLQARGQGKAQRIVRGD